MFIKTSSRPVESRKSVLPPARIGLIAIVLVIVVSWIAASVGMAL